MEGDTDKRATDSTPEKEEDTSRVPDDLTISDKERKRSRTDCTNIDNGSAEMKQITGCLETLLENKLPWCDLSAFISIYSMVYIGLYLAIYKVFSIMLNEPSSRKLFSLRRERDVFK